MPFVPDYRISILFVEVVYVKTKKAMLYEISVKCPVKLTEKNLSMRHTTQLVTATFG